MRRRLLGALAWGVGLGTALVVGGCGQPGYHVPAPVAGIGDPQRGQQVISAYGCGSCHIIPGVRAANGLVGPPLTRFGARSYIAGELPNNFPNLVRWIMNPQAVEPGTAMPDLGVSLVNAQDIASYLLSLE